MKESYVQPRDFSNRYNSVCLFLAPAKLLLHQLPNVFSRPGKSVGFMSDQEFKEEIFPRNNPLPRPSLLNHMDFFAQAVGLVNW